jgi:phage-related protein
MSDYNERERSVAIAKDFFEESVRFLDGKFGKGYSQKHEEQLNAYMQSTSIIYASLVNSKKMNELTNELRKNTIINTNNSRR